MVKLYALASVVGFALLVFCVVDIIGSPAHRVRNLPKVAWLLLVLFFPLVGSIAWLVAGRPEKTARTQRRHERAAPDFPEYDRPGRAAAVDPTKDEEFLRQVRERAEEQRKRYEASRNQDPSRTRSPSPTPSRSQSASVTSRARSAPRISSPNPRPSAT